MTRASINKARRPRAARACDACRLKKNKCDEQLPCTYCRNRKIACAYKGQDAGSGRVVSDYVGQLEGQVKYLSGLLESRNDTPPNAAAEVLPPQQTLDTLTPFDMASFALTVPPQRQDEHEAPSTVGSTSSRPAGDQEVSGINRHTRNVEFYGNSSSLALLSHVQRTGLHDVHDGPEAGVGHGAALVSSLHNPGFCHTLSPRPSQEQSECDPLIRQQYQAHHFSHCRGFIDGYFSAIHYIHPIIDKQLFLERCRPLWSGAEATSAPTGFTALYYSVLSLGALVGNREEDPVDGVSNLQWSRKFFDVAKAYCNQLGLVTNLDMVQCYFILAKVCQNELSPHLSYMFVGLAVRTALAMGINREPGPNSKLDSAQRRAESRTWWGLYSLETEISFAMGRPDTLGADLYHNRMFPKVRDTSKTDTGQHKLMDPPHCAIIEIMVDFSKITRSICLGIYLEDGKTIADTLDVVHRIEQDLDRWVESIPEGIRPDRLQGPLTSLRSAKDPQWMKRQRLVLNIRYYNLRILLFGSLLLKSSTTEFDDIPGTREDTQKCLNAACRTIDIIYRTYEHNDFFRTWFYNTTYTVFAASIILVYIMREATEEESKPLIREVEMAIEILEIMDECVVALEAAKLLRRGKEKAERTTSPPHDPAQRLTEGSMLLNHYWGPMDLLDGTMDLDFVFQLGDLDIPSSMPGPQV